MSLELRRQPPGFSQILTRRSSAGGEKQGTMEAANPGDSGHRQRGGVGELEKENEPHPLVPVARRERVG